MRTVGKPVRFYNNNDGGTNVPVFDGFDGGVNLGGRDVWVTPEVFEANMKADIERNGFAEEWVGTRQYATSHAIETEHGTLYAVVDCSFSYEHEHENPEEVVDGCLACEDGRYVRELLARRAAVDAHA